MKSIDLKPVLEMERLADAKAWLDQNIPEWEELPALEVMYRMPFQYILKVGPEVIMAQAGEGVDLDTCVYALDQVFCGAVMACAGYVSSREFKGEKPDKGEVASAVRAVAKMFEVTQHNYQDMPEKIWNYVAGVKRRSARDRIEILGMAKHEGVEGVERLAVLVEQSTIQEAFCRTAWALVLQGHMTKELVGGGDETKH